MHPQRGFDTNQSQGVDVAINLGEPVPLLLRDHGRDDVPVIGLK